MTKICVLWLLAAGMMQAQSPRNASEQTIVRIEEEMLAALLKGDASASERYLAETYVFTGPDGGSMDKTVAIQILKSGDLKFTAASLDELKIQLHGDTAIVTYSSNDKGTFKGKDISGKTRWTDVLVKQKGYWKFVASHGSPVK